MVPESPSARVTLLMERSTWSSLLMVPSPWLSEMVALALSLERLTKKVSLASTLVSPVTSTDTVWLRVAVPARKVSEPEAAA